MKKIIRILVIIIVAYCILSSYLAITARTKVRKLKKTNQELFIANFVLKQENAELKTILYDSTSVTLSKTP
jgi:hypothetical protein